MRKKRVSKRKPMRRRAPRRLRDVADRASCSERRTLQSAPGVLGFNTGLTYALMNTQLSDYNRASEIAANYQSYRIKKVTLTVKPSYDSFIAAAGAVSKPNLYYMIDKQGALPANINLAGLKSAGAKPRALDERPISISWGPSVLEAVMYGVVAPAGQLSASKYKVSPWLSCNSLPLGGGGAFIASSLDHLGIYWYVDALINPVGMQYTVECEVQFEFKKPANYQLVTTQDAVSATIAPFNTSPDGVIGGGDDDRV